MNYNLVTSVAPTQKLQTYDIIFIASRNDYAVHAKGTPREIRAEKIVKASIYQCECQTYIAEKLGNVEKTYKDVGVTKIELKKP